MDSKIIGTEYYGVFMRPDLLCVFYGEETNLGRFFGLPSREYIFEERTQNNNDPTYCNFVVFHSFLSITTLNNPTLERSQKQFAPMGFNAHGNQNPLCKN